MLKEGIPGFILDDKPVYDWNGAPLGVVSDLERDPKTRAARRLIVNLTPEAKHTIGTAGDSLEIPISYVFGIRKDAVSLNRSAQELKASDAITRLLQR